MTVKEDFIKLYGEKKTLQVIENAGNHSSMCAVPVPEDEDRILCFSLLKMIDFQCFMYKDGCNCGLSEEQIKEFLINHKETAIRCPVPTYVGLLVGAFDFLK